MDNAPSSSTATDSSSCIAAAAAPPLTPLATILSASSSRSATVRLANYRGMRTARVFSSTAAELRGLLAGTGVYDLGWRNFLLCTGDDRVRWLNGMVTNSVTGLSEGAGCYAFVLSAQGRIQGDLTIFQRADALWLQTDAAQMDALTAFLDRYIIMDDVTLQAQTSWTAIGIAGPKAQETLAAVGLTAGGMSPIQIREAAWRSQPAFLVAAHSPLVSRFELWMPASGAFDLWQALTHAGAEPCGADAMEQLRILEGVPAYHVDITTRELAQETGQQHALHFAKGCYLGQEIVERIRSRGNVHRTFSGFVLRVGGDVPLPAPKTPVLADGQPAGELTSVARIQLPDVDEVVLALGYIRREALDRGAALTCAGASIAAAPLPFDLAHLMTPRATGGDVPTS